jgi:hypothetical protein
VEKQYHSDVAVACEAAFHAASLTAGAIQIHALL